MARHDQRRPAVDVTAYDSALVITPARRVRGGFDLAQLVERIPADYKPEALDWGPPVDREVW
jgi:antitoxin component of MazEF toxin-antitoxin module